ncbi:hypothetical protein C8R47DRAFT_1022842, partial [Mycena vitilis]
MLGALKADRVRIAEIDAQILDLQRSFLALQSERKQAQRRLNAYKFPVLTLPPEIISEIFVRTLPIYPHFPARRGSLSPTTLAQICRSWREIALTTPLLWRAISLRLLGLYAFEQRVHIFNVWLQRSRVCPLSI